MLKIKAITIAVFATLALTSEAAPRTKAQMQAIATRVINQHHSAKGMAPRHGTLKVLKETASYEIIGYEEGSFAVVSADDLVPEVLGVSASTHLLKKGALGYFSRFLLLSPSNTSTC